MRSFFFVLFLILLFSAGLWAETKNNLNINLNINLNKEDQKIISARFGAFYSFSETQLNDLIVGKPVSFGKVSSLPDKTQELKLFVLGAHPKKCQKVMRKLSLYENYHSYLDFIKQSHYDDKTKAFSFIIHHFLLPYDMSVRFKIPRITKQGLYPFMFDQGFLKKLKGTIMVQEIKGICFLGLKADWRGPETKFPDALFSAFLETVGRLGLEHLIRVSRF